MTSLTKILWKKKNKKKVKLSSFPSILFPFPKDNSAKQCSVHLVFSFMAWYKALSYLFGIYQSQSIYCFPVTKNEALSSPGSSSLAKPPIDCALLISVLLPFYSQCRKYLYFNMRLHSVSYASYLGCDSNS